MWDFKNQIEKLMIFNQPYIVVVKKLQKNEVVINVAISSDSNIKKKKHKHLKKIQRAERGRRKEVESEGSNCASVNQSIWGCDTQTAREWLQQIPGAPCIVFGHSLKHIFHKTDFSLGRATSSLAFTLVILLLFSCMTSMLIFHKA